MSRASQQQPAVDQESITAELVDRLSRYDGPPEQFLVNLLAVQCYLAAAESGVILRIGADGATEILAVHPPPQGETHFCPPAPARRPEWTDWKPSGPDLFRVADFTSPHH